MKKILIVTANPHSTTRLSLDSEVNSIQGNLRIPLLREQFDVSLLTGATRLLLQRRLNEYDPHILHFSTHGLPEGIILEDDCGNQDVYSSEALADLLGQMNLLSGVPRNLQCVILNSCHSQDHLIPIVRHVDYAIGMREAIRDQLAIRFSSAFYYALASGLNYRRAFGLGRNVVFDLEQPILEFRLEEEEERDVRRRVSRVLKRGSTEDVDLIADAALYVSDSRYDHKRLIREAIENRRFVPTKYLYSTNEGCARWLEACDLNRDPYPYYRNAVDLLRTSVESIISNAISRSSSSSAEFDFISLGCGDGKKDKIILEAMSNAISEDQKIYYYPIDISDPMIVEAIRNVRGDSQDRNFRRKVLIKAIVGDFTALQPAMEFVYEERPNNNFFSVLGNTIGNSSEREIIEALDNAMFPGDFALIEVNIDQDSLNQENIDSIFYTTEQNKRRQFIPLEIWGVSFEPDNFQYSVDTGDSMIDPDHTKTLKTFYGNAVIAGKRCDHQVLLAKIHHYNYETFPNRINQRLHTRTICSWRSQDVGLFLLQKINLDRATELMS
jgi:uncharacterized SAM-dependent methyltransferase